jgi:hypothetical protein
MAFEFARSEGRDFAGILNDEMVVVLAGPETG